MALYILHLASTHDTEERGVHNMGQEGYVVSPMLQYNLNRSSDILISISTYLYARSAA